MSPDVETAAAALVARLREAGTPERAAGEKRYLKSELEHFGVTMPRMRRELQTWAQHHADPSHSELIALVRILWSQPVFECRMAATLLLVRFGERVQPGDLDLLNELVRDSRTWALVDQLAANVLGELVIRHPDAAAQLDAWATDGDFWVRRAALLSQLRPLSRGAAFDRFAGYAEGMLDEREFFIQKAIGWVLRSTSRRDPETVYRWLAARIDRASGVTVREAVKYLAPERRDELLAAYRARRH